LGHMLFVVAAIIMKTVAQTSEVHPTILLVYK